MQAITVLLLEYAQGTVHLETNAKKSLPTCVEKLTGWLQAMRSVDGVADRAYKLVRRMTGANDDQETVDKSKPTTRQPHDDNVAKAFAVSDSSNFYQEPQHQESTWPQGSLSDSTLPQMHSSEFDLNAMGWPLNDDSLLADLQFGQSQMPLFFGNQFATSFDQDMEYYAGSAGTDDFDMQYGQN